MQFHSIDFKIIVIEVKKCCFRPSPMGSRDFENQQKIKDEVCDMPDCVKLKIFIRVGNRCPKDGKKHISRNC